MEKGSLDTILWGSKDSELSWEIKLQMALDCANAMAYLHAWTPQPIIHRGPQWILCCALTADLRVLQI